MNQPRNGYEILVRVSPVIEPWMPLYAQVEEGVFSIGTHLLPSHCNSRGFAHGGVVGTLADLAMGYSVQQSDNSNESGRISAMTTNLSTDFLKAGKQGQWIEFRPNVLRRGSAMAVAECYVYADDELIARSNASFRVV